jgi:hypothetical protein
MAYYAEMDHRAGEHSAPRRNVAWCKLCREAVERGPSSEQDGKAE